MKTDKEKIVIIGAGGHAKVVIEIINSIGDYEIIGVVAREDEEKDKIQEYKVFKGDQYLDMFFKDGIKNAAIGIGGFRDNHLRKEMFTKVKQIGYKLPPLIHPSVIISSSVSIGAGSVVYPGVIINSEVEIGENSIIATGSSIDHETIIQDHVLISAGVTVGAYVTVEKEALLALGCKVVSGMTIGERVLIASGAVVVHNLSANDIVFGVPAKKRHK